MKPMKRILSMLLVIATSFTICASTLAAPRAEEIMPQSTLRLSASLSSSLASARGRSTDNDYLTVSFTLYTSSGGYITSGSNSGYGDVTASKSVSLSSGSYKIVATVSGGGNTSQTFYFNI